MNGRTAGGLTAGHSLSNLPGGEACARLFNLSPPACRIPHVRCPIAALDFIGRKPRDLRISRWCSALLADVALVSRYLGGYLQFARNLRSGEIADEVHFSIGRLLGGD